MNGYRALGVAILAASTACGGAFEPANGVVGIRLRPVESLCPREIPAMQAKLEISGQNDDCPLVVQPDYTVTGTCRGIPVGEVMEFRLVYFVMLENDPVPQLDLATAIEQLDLRRSVVSTVQLQFTKSGLRIDMDDDQDNTSNLAEVCAGTNPRG